jgi:pimeloyl-ACP methyl ester carboxylesterase
VSDPPHVDGVTHRQVRARGIDFHVAEAGSGNDVVLCLHGWPQHWYEWRHLMPALADRHRVLALDLRGFGWSDAPRDGYEKENMATDVLAVLDALGRERVKLVGHDWGGWIAFLLCLRARAAVQMYRVFNLRETLPIVRGRYRRQQLTVPTRMLFGTDDRALRPEILAGYQRHAENMSLELVPGCGHFIADERPDLVAERAREFFSE